MNPPSVILLYDAAGWAHDHKGVALETHFFSDSEFQVRSIFQERASDVVLNHNDLVLIHHAGQLDMLPRLRDWCSAHRSKVMIGICDALGNEEQRAAELRQWCAAVFVINSAVYSRLFGTPGVYYLPNGVDLEHFQPVAKDERAEDEPLVIGWAGNLLSRGAEFRGMSQIIEPAIEKLGGRAILVKTGPGTPQTLTWDQMPAFYQALDLYVCASESEGTPNPCMEAMACGVPVISTRVGVMPDVIERGVNGWLIERNAADLADKVLAFRGLSWLPRKQMRRYARLMMEPWSWKIMGENYRRMFREVHADNL